MSAIPPPDVPCRSCGAANPPTNAYCGGCGHPLGMAPPPQGAPVISHRGYRGPRRMLIVSGVFFVISALIAAAAFAAIQAKGASGFGMDIGGPIVNRLLDTAGIDQIRAPETEDGGTSWLTLAAFLLAFLVAGISLFVLACASAWLLVRWSSRERPG